MKPSTAWIAIVLLALGVCGILDMTGVVAWSSTVALWWPLAIAGWALTEMLVARRVTAGGIVCTAVGIVLLADVQAWASGGLLWSVLAITLGLGIVAGAVLRRGGRRDGDTPAAS